jgi:hypothetical protein
MKRRMMGQDNDDCSQFQMINTNGIAPTHALVQLHKNTILLPTLL